MERDNVLKTTRERIADGPEGTMWITSDFADIASADSANRALLRLEGSGFIRRVVRGVYEKPQFNTFLQENVEPSPDKVARALARNYGWRIIPSGDTALNMLGLSTQVPSAWVYVSDGPYKEYRLNGLSLKFKHTAHKELSQVSDKTALVIQAIKALGKQGATASVTGKISSLLKPEEKKKMLTEAQHTTAWIYEAIKKIAAFEGSL